MLWLMDMNAWNKNLLNMIFKFIWLKLLKIEKNNIKHIQKYFLCPDDQTLSFIKVVSDEVHVWA